MPVSTKAGRGGQTDADQKLEEIKLAEWAHRKEILEEKKARRVKASGGVTVAQATFAETGNAEDFHRENRDIHSALGSVGGSPFGRIERVKEAQDARVEADRVDVAEKKREESEASQSAAKELKMMTVAAAAAVAGLWKIDAIASEMQASQSSGAKTAGDYRSRISSAMSRLGYSKEEQDAAIRQGETEGGLGSHMTRQKQTEAYEAAVAGLKGAPPALAQRGAIEDVIQGVGSGKIPWELGKSSLSGSFLPQVGIAMGSAGMTPRTRLGVQAEQNEAGIQKITDVSEAKMYTEGTSNRNVDAYLDATSRESFIGKMGTWFGFNSIAGYGEAKNAKYEEDQETLHRMQIQTNKKLLENLIGKPTTNPSH